MTKIPRVELVEEIKTKITDTLIEHEYISDWVNTAIDLIVESLQKEKEKEIEARDQEWRDAIQGLINVSNEHSSDDWFNGLRACKSIKLPTK